MKTDSIFYLIFKTAPVLFFELIGEPYHDGYQFESIEVKETTCRHWCMNFPKADAGRNPFDPKASLDLCLT